VQNAASVKVCGASFEDSIPMLGTDATESKSTGTYDGSLDDDFNLDDQPEAYSDHRADDGHGDAWEHPLDQLPQPEPEQQAKQSASLPTPEQPEPTTTKPEPQAAQSSSSEARPNEDGLQILSCAQLITRYPTLRPPVIDGLLREGETMNLIAPSKVGKSWAVIDLALACAMGENWLDTFYVKQGNVLIIDNELHPETLAFRLQTMLTARGISLESIGGRIDIASLRGRLLDLESLGAKLRKIERGHYRLIVIDAFYRTLPKDADENANGQIAGLYNLLDSYADSTGAGFVLVHHASKGNQSTKGVADVGAGAGAQSRAADTHLIFRQHEQDGVHVLDAAVRSWQPVTPICLRWNWPLWTPDATFDASALRSERPRKKKSENPEDVWDAKRFAAAFGTVEWTAQSKILREASNAKLSNREAKRLLREATDVGYLAEQPGEGRRPSLYCRGND
jgi:hypothetical protein